MKRKMVILASILFLSVPVYSQTSNFGLGIQLGEPTGINAKLWTSSVNAVDFGLAWSFEGRNEMIIQADYVWHSFNVFPVSSGKLPLYFGIGGRAILRDDPQLGARIPVGIAYMFESIPLDVFAEIAPILNVIPSTDFDLGGGVGVRFRF